MTLVKDAELKTKAGTIFFCQYFINMMLGAYLLFHYDD
jgi:hypothetical protein